MVRIDVDYNERDGDGRVVAHVPEGQLKRLHGGQAVSLYDPVDHLWADATVAWTEPETGAAGFEVDWTSFVDGDLPEPESPKRIYIAFSYSDVNLCPIIRPSYPTELALTTAFPPAPVKRNAIKALRFFFTSRSNRDVSRPLAVGPLVLHFSILLVPVEQEQPSSSSDVGELNTRWELTSR